MIPLAHWLVEKAEGGYPSIPTIPDTASDSIEHSIEDDKQATAAIPQQESRLQMLEQALHDAEERLAQMVEEHACKERELADRLGEALTKRVALEIGAAFQSLQQNIESAVAETLVPFLETAAQDRALTSLTDLIREEVKNRDAPVLGIRSPAIMHGPLSEALRETGIEVRISEAATVDIEFTGERLRFQTLASAWCAAIRKDEA